MNLWRRIAARSSEEPYVPDLATIRREVEIESVVNKAHTVFEVWPTPTNAPRWTADHILEATGSIVTRQYVEDLLRGHSEDHKLTKWIVSSVVGYPNGPLGHWYEMSFWERPMWWWRMVREKNKLFPQASKLREVYTPARHVASDDLQDLSERPAHKARLLYPTASERGETPEWYTVETLHPIWACSIFQITSWDLAWLADPLFNPRPEITQVGNSSGQLQPDNLPDYRGPEDFLLGHGNITREHGDLDKAYDPNTPQLVNTLTSDNKQDLLRFRVHRKDVARLMRPPNIEIEREAIKRVEAVNANVPQDWKSRVMSALRKEGGS